jgi:hypothetical protein
MSKSRSRLSAPAMILAVIALVVAIGGTAIGAGVLTNKAFKKKSVRGPVTYVNSSKAITQGGTAQPVSALCPDGFTVLGGGIHWTDPIGPNTVITESHPVTSGNNTGWGGYVYTESVGGKTTITTAICAKSKQVTGAPPSN